MRGMFDLTDKVAIITGGTGVLGGAMAEGLAAAGARVAILGRREAKATEVALKIELKVILENDFINCATSILFLYNQLRITNK